MITYLGLAHIRPYGFDSDRVGGWGGDGNIPWTCTHPANTGWMGWVGGMLGLAYRLPYGFDVDRLDGLGGWVGDGNIPWACIHPPNAGWMGWVGWVGGVG